jgi:D-amino-acid oxidase
MTSRNLGVVGAGVIGLSTALVAQEHGHAVTVYSPLDPLETTSAKAAASFKPHDVAFNGLARTMLTRAWDRFDRLARHAGPACGVRRHTHWEASSRPLRPAPHLDVVEDLATATWPDVPGGYPYGRRYTTFFIDIPVYMSWLHARFLENGGEFVPLAGPFRHLDDLQHLPHDVIFNCTGLGARALCNDELVHPIKGQLALVGPQPQMDWSISADGFYVYPRSTDTVLGGTSESRVETETVDDTVIALLLKANARILPQLSVASVIRTVAGLRPYREHSIRLAAQDNRGQRVIHNYGHGGAGITLSWGSAGLAFELMQLPLQQR